MSIFKELERRNVIRVGTAYVVGAWLVIQVIETLFPVFDLSDKAIRIVVIVLAIGFIPAVVFAWIYEWTPQGFMRDEDAGEHYTPDRTSRMLDRMIIVILALGIAYFVFDRFVLEPERAAEREAEVTEQT